MALSDAGIDEEMRATWKDIQAKHAADEPEPAPAAEASAAAEAPPVADDKQADTRARDESGKFVKKEADSPAPKAEKQQTPAKAAAPKEAPKADAPLIGANAIETPGEATRDVNRAPSSWKPQAKAAWDALPVEIRSEIHRRESDFLNGQSQLLPDAQLGKSLRSVIAPYQAMIAGEGGTPESAVNELLRTAAALRMGSPDVKMQTLRSIAHRYGIDLAAPQGQPQQEQAPQYRDPRVDQLLADQQRQAQEAQAAENARITAIADQWMKETDPSGKPLRPFVDNVQTEMLALLPVIREAQPHLPHREMLQQAYERAVWANPDTARVMEQQRLQELEAKRRAENQQQVDAAKKAASVNVPRRGSTPVPAKPGSMEETIRNTARALGMIN